MTDTDNTYNNIEELLPRFCEGMTTAAESRLVEEWIEQDESHRKIMNQIHALYLATDTLHVMKSVDTEKALRKVKGRMNKKKNLLVGMDTTNSCDVVHPAIDCCFVDVSG